MLNFYQILIILLTVVPLFFILNFFSEKNTITKSNFFMGIFMLIIFLQFFFLLGEVLYYPRLAIVSYYVVIPLLLLNAPALFLYCRKLSSENFRLWPEIILHILPAALLLTINIITFSQVDSQTKYAIVTHDSELILQSQQLSFYLKSYKTAQTFYNVQVLLYTVLMIYILIAHNKKIKNFFSYNTQISLNWLKVFVVFFGLISFVDVTLYTWLAPEVYYFILLTYIVFLGIFGKRQSDIYVTKNIIINPQSRNDIIIQNEDKPHNVTEENFLSQKLDEKQAASIIALIEKSLQEKKIFKNNKLTLEDMANEVAIHKNYLSYIINNHLNKNFYLLVNEYRIEEAKKLLHDPSYDNFSIEGIAQTVGFNSKSVFNPIFKKTVGFTPSQYRKDRKQP